MDQALDDDWSDTSSSSYSQNSQSVGGLEDNNLLSKFIIHLDVDCFYCQTEEIRNPSLASKPLAIGQKHIIVTSNYVARKMGVKKLQGRREALRSCPSLIIIEGSDLEPYRDASRSIYTVFRTAVKELSSTNTVRKGGMDEYFADITFSVNNELVSSSAPVLSHDGVWIYGDDSIVAQITEDQSGASSTTFWNRKDTSGEMWGNKEEINICASKMKVAARIARRIQEKVKQETGFSTTVGISSSPMLSKLASDLKKPKSCNILYPWRSANMIASMPLRRVPDLGSRTLRSLATILNRYNGEEEEEGKSTEFWTCKDLLNIPRHELHSCLLEKDKSGKFCDLLLNRCKGIDTMLIEDDQGILTKTISVEESFVTGSLTCIIEVTNNLRILFVRLLRLLDKRKGVSHSPENAYPQTIRLTARIVDRSVTTNRRSFRNISRQAAFPGKVMMGIDDNDERIASLKRYTIPLLQLLNELTIDLNVTRLNLATSSFPDLNIKEKDLFYSKDALSSNSKKQRDLTAFFQHTSKITSEKHPCGGALACKPKPSHSIRSSHISETSFRKPNEGANNNVGSQNKKRTREGPTSVQTVESTDTSQPTCMQDVIDYLKRKGFKKRKTNKQSST